MNNKIKQIGEKFIGPKLKNSEPVPEIFQSLSVLKDSNDRELKHNDVFGVYSRDGELLDKRVLRYIHREYGFRTATFDRIEKQEHIYLWEPIDSEWVQLCTTGGSKIIYLGHYEEEKMEIKMEIKDKKGLIETIENQGLFELISIDNDGSWREGKFGDYEISNGWFKSRVSGHHQQDKEVIYYILFSYIESGRDLEDAITINTLVSSGLADFQKAMDEYVDNYDDSDLHLM